jgi:PAS domain S-box-containing protein
MVAKPPDTAPDQPRHPHGGRAEVVARVQRLDWNATPLGGQSRWSVPLKTVSGVVLASGQPMFLVWGPDRIWLYNDALIPLLGERHPSALGQPASEAWADMRDELVPAFDRVFAGDFVQLPALTLVQHRDGAAPKPIRVVMSCTPVQDETGRVAGILGTCVELEAKPGDGASVIKARSEEAAALESEQRFLEIADAAPVLMWRSDADGVGVWFNKAWLSLTGRTLAEESAGGWGASIHPDDQQRRLAVIQRSVETQQPFRIDYRLLGGDSEWRIVDETAVPQLARDGRLVGFLGCCIEVTDQRATELALRHREEQLRLATDAAEIGLWDVDPLADTLYWPPRMKAMFGISPDRPVSMQDFYDGLHPEDRAMVAAAFAAAHDPCRRALYDVEYRAVGKEDGGVRWIAAKGRGVFDESGRCTRVIGTAIDITARKQAEDQLRQLAGTLEQRVAERTAERDRVWRNSRDLLVVLGTDGVFRAVNPAWKRLLGHSPEEVVGRSVLDYLWPEDIDAGQWPPCQAGTTDFDTRYRHQDGTPRWISWHVSVEGELIFAYGRDISAEKDQQEALLAAEEQLRHAQKMEAVGQLTGGLAHDFNNLLTGIAGSLELLKGRLAQGRVGELDRYINAAQGATRRAAVLTHRLLAFSRRQTLDPKPVQANRLIAEMEELIRRTIGPSISLEVHGAEDLWTTFADPNQLENAVLNLCINARDAMPDGGRLTVATENLGLEGRAAQSLTVEPGQYVAISVTDTGVGMPPEVIERAFDPFYTTKPIGMGTGLGLSMIYGFTKQSGGQARITSEVDQGTRVCMYLPRHLGDLVSEEASGQSGEAPRAREGETVLVVDDEPTVRMLITDILEDLGYCLLEAGDGATALKVLQSDRRIDLLVTDVGLPGGMNGRQVADAGRALRPGLRVLFITGYAETSVLPSGSLTRGMQVLTKPFRVDELADRIKGLIEPR